MALESNCVTAPESNINTLTDTDEKSSVLKTKSNLATALEPRNLSSYNKGENKFAASKSTLDPATKSVDVSSGNADKNLVLVPESNPVSRPDPEIVLTKNDIENPILLCDKNKESNNEEETNIKEVAEIQKLMHKYISFC